MLRLKLRRFIRGVVVSVATELVVAAVVRPFDKRRVNVDQVLDTQACIDKVLDFFDPETVHVPTDSVSMVSHLVDHVPIRLTEPIVVLKEVTMAVNVSHHKLVIGNAVASQQVRVAGIVVDHQFVDFLQSVRITFRQLFVFHPKTPVRIACRKAAVRSDGV